jgi:hypothetical protein
MGSIISAINDDEDEWHLIKSSFEIKDVKWGVYSEEARHAKFGFNEFGFKGRRLKLYVKHMLERTALEQRQDTEVRELEKLKELENKYA